MSNLTRLLGLSPDEEIFTTFVSDLGVEPEINEDEQGGGLYYTFKDLGLELVFSHVDPYQLLACIFLFSGGADERGYHEDYKRYKGVIPHGLTFDMSRSQVREKLGAPSSCGEPEADRYLRGIQPAWDNYVFGKHEMFVEYLSECKGIYIIKLLIPESLLSRLHERW
jgi:hypothetical protein